MLNVVCLKHGTKYNAHYVNILYNMISRHLTVPYDFYCFTEDPTGINSDIKIKELPVDSLLTGWWWKPYIFKQGHFSDGDEILFFDLDLVIVNSIDAIATYMPEKFVGLKDVSRVFGTVPEKLGSAVMKWPANQYSDIWNNIESNNFYTKRFFGDQDWIWHLHKQNIVFYPEEWIRSYKWEVRTRKELIRIGNAWNFKEIKHPILDSATCILAFHGTPNPHEVMDPIIVDNWR